MSHNPDFQKDEIMAHKKREIEDAIRAAQKFGARDKEFRMEPMRSGHGNDSRPPQTGLASRFESVMYAPDYSTDERRVKLLAWAWENRHAITHALDSYDAEQVSA